MQDTDETQGSYESMPASEWQGEQHAKSGGVQLNRRRLVQGAAVAVPTILTLRSGGISAASLCPGQIAGTATVNNDGTLNYTEVTGPLRTDDVCFKQVTACSGSSTRVESALPGDIVGSVTPNSTGGFTCGTYTPAATTSVTTTTKKKKGSGTTTSSPTTSSNTVVILTHSSTVSLI